MFAFIILIKIFENRNKPSGAKIMKTLTKTITTFEVLEYIIDNSFKCETKWITEVIVRMESKKEITMNQTQVLISKMITRFN